MLAGRTANETSLEEISAKVVCIDRGRTRRSVLHNGRAVDTLALLRYSDLPGVHLSGVYSRYPRGYGQANVLLVIYYRAALI